MAAPQVSTLLHEFLARSAERWPDRPALEIPPGRDRSERLVLTYRELAERSTRLAMAVAPFVRREAVVAVLLPRTSDHLWCAQLAALEAGAAFTSIDPSFPDDRIREILDDAQPVAILADKTGRERTRGCGFDADLVLDVEAALAAPVENPGPKALSARPWLTPSSLAYVIYTSGTTGRPKGVMIEHRSIANLIASDIAEFGLTPSDRVGQGSSAAYDSSLEEAWLAWGSGAALVVLDDDTARLGPDLVPWLRGERITVFCPPPTLLRATGCENPDQALPDLSLLYVGGESLSVDVASRWGRGRRLVNGYGPTECTVTALRGDVQMSDLDSARPVTIGHPVAGLEALVLDDALEPVADGERGELFLGGLGLARGYHGDPKLTSEKFFDHAVYGRLYRTGDDVERRTDGSLLFHGRLDSQVKLHGYRIELEAIETRLGTCRGVRQAACRIQGEAGRQLLVAHVVPEDPRDPPGFEKLASALAASLPPYMVPARFALIDQLPRTAGAKIDRSRLPHLPADRSRRGVEARKPGSLIETEIADAFANVLDSTGAVSIDDDFFDLGGDSLRAAQLVSLLRIPSRHAGPGDPTVLTVRDVYDQRSIAKLAAVALERSSSKVALPFCEKPAPDQTVDPDPVAPLGRRLGTTAIQASILAVALLAAAPLLWVFILVLFPFLLRLLGPVFFLVLVPMAVFLGRLLWAPAAAGLAVLAKRLLIGRYRARIDPAWGSFYVRNWVVQSLVRMAPWSLVSGTEYQSAVLRALGARIGHRVDFQGGATPLGGGWDLLEIGDDVTLGRDASLRLATLDQCRLSIAPITLGNRVTLDVRAGVDGGSTLEDNAYLGPLSSLSPGGRIPVGERWDGVPAEMTTSAPARAEPEIGGPSLTPRAYAATVVAARAALGALMGLPTLLALIGFVSALDLDAERILAALFGPGQDLAVIGGGFLLLSAMVPATVAMQAVVTRALGPLPTGAMPRWSLLHIRLSLKTSLVHSAGEWLSGTLFWPAWLRLAGMAVGKGCEISTIIDAVPDQVEIGDDSFLADGIYLGGPISHRGVVTAGRTRLDETTFLGNHVVIPSGSRLPERVLLGISTVAHQDQLVPGSAWFGHPPFELPAREIVACDRRLTHHPSKIRYVNRLLWEAGRFGLPVLGLGLLVAWLQIVGRADAAGNLEVLILGWIPAVTLAVGAMSCLSVLVLKWGLLGRVRPGVHPLWSCWCSRWDFLYVAWRRFARPILASLEGTLLLPWFLRAMGARIGRGVALGGGFSQVVDPDMLTFEDGATVNAMFQAHTFEDRVLKIDWVAVRRGATVADAAVLLYGADVGPGARVGPHSVVMKHEVLTAGTSYEGCPAAPIGPG